MTTACGGPECDRPARARGYCEMHYRQWRKTATVKKLRGRRKPCRVDGCGKPSHAQELCPKHYYRLLKNGSPHIVKADEPDALAERMRRRDKRCASCGQVKSFEAFYASNFTPDGCSYSCRVCSSAKQSEWHKSHRVENRERSYRRRELERQGTGIDVDLLWSESPGTCPDCGIGLDREAQYPSENFGSIDHVIPLSKGGEHSQHNVRLTCLSCNFRKGAKMPFEPLHMKKEIAG